MSDTEIRLFFFLGCLGVLVILELFMPYNRATTKTRPFKRWLNHFSLSIISVLLTKLLLPVGLVGAAIYFQSNGLGLFNLLNLTGWFAAIAGVIVLDFVIYWQHRLFHTSPLLWRLHRLHHIDPNVDVTTAVRFHPVEIVISLGIKVVVVFTLGIPPESVVLFEIVLSSLALFNHSNIQMPDKIERIVRFFLITPSVHRIHHSVIHEESQKNFGFSVPYWDQLFGTYATSSRQAKDQFQMGVEDTVNTNENLLTLLKDALRS